MNSRVFSRSVFSVYFLCLFSQPAQIMRRVTSPWLENVSGELLNSCHLQTIVVGGANYYVCTILFRMTAGVTMTRFLQTIVSTPRIPLRVASTATRLQLELIV